MRKFYGEDCATTNNATVCDFSNAECVNSVCRCAATHVYDNTGGGCVTECVAYGSEFIAYTGTYLKGRRSAVTNSASSDECKNSCLSRTDFVCRSIDYGELTGQCYMDEDVPEQEGDMMPHADYNFYRRQCA